MALTTLEGRLPATPTEIAFGTRTLAQLGLSIGDTTSTIPTGGGASVPLTVVGTAVLPATEEYSVGVGAVVTGEGMARFAQGDFSYNPVLDFAPDADVATVQADLSDDYGLDFNLFTEPRPQGEVANLAEPGEIAAALAGFLLLLGVVGLVHVLMVSIRRRRRDLGVLRALGLRGRQAEWAVIVEALALTAGGLVIGLPVGAIVGRAVWSALVADLGAVADAQWPWWLLLALLPAAAVLAVALSWWPAHRVRVASPAVSLRSE